MVEPRDPEEMPPLDSDVLTMTLEEIGDLKLEGADTDALRTLFMWKSIAAENVRASDSTPEPPEAFRDGSIDELRDKSLTAVTSRGERLQLVEYYLWKEGLQTGGSLPRQGSRYDVHRRSGWHRRSVRGRTAPVTALRPPP
jgi:hypothetical protein